MAKKKCKTCKGYGVLFFRAYGSFDSPVLATIERCDVCKIYETDLSASEAVERVWRAACKQHAL